MIKSKIMIDGKKIEEVARAYCDATYGTLKEEPFIAESFRQGAEWAQKEFINSLWHDASEKPMAKRHVIALTGKRIFVYDFHLKEDDDNWAKKFHFLHIVRWTYLDDLLPKEGGEE